MSISSASSTKKRRLVLSCSECKRRKLKCDRQTPICSRCIMMGHSELCKYDPRFFSGSLDTRGSVEMDFTENFSSFDFNALLSSTTGENDHQSQNELRHFELNWDPERAYVEESTDHLIQQTPPQDMEITVGSSDTQGRQTTLQPSQVFQGCFKGPSHWMSVIASFDGLSGYLRATIQRHSLLGGSRWAANRSTSASPRPLYPRESVAKVMKDLLPAKQRCLELSRSYFTHFAGLHGLFHISSFWQEYKAFVDGTHDNSACFNVILLALISCSRCLLMDEPLSFDGDGSTARNEIVRWLSALEAWLDGRKGRKISLVGLQVRCLVLFSKAINDIDSTYHYRDSQTLLADAIFLGLHRDAAVLSATESIFEREIRRKLWSAVAELSIARCLERGLPSIASNLISDIGPPENFKDTDYDSSVVIEPAKYPDVEFTDNSFTRVVHSTRALRLSIIDLVNNPHRHMSINRNELADLQRQINQAIAEIPRWSLASLTGESTDSSLRGNQIICRASLQLQLHELLILLNLPFAFQKSMETTADADYLRFICWRSSEIIIRIYEMVANEGFSQMTLPKNNLLRAGLCICLLATRDSNRGISSITLKPAPTTTLTLVDAALQMAEQRVLTLGTGIQRLWLLSAARSFVEVGENPAASALCKKRITDDIIALITKMCMTQQKKEMGFGFSDKYLASHVLDIQRICDEVGLLSDGKMLFGVACRPVPR